MNALTILKKLPGLKTSGDFDAAIDTLETAHSEATAAVAALESKREDLIFSGGDLAKLEADISAAVGRAKTLAVALSGAEKRREQAAEAERQAELEALANDARKLNKTLRARLIAFGENAETLAALAETIKTLRAEINTANNTARAAGRADLAIDDPVRDLVEIVGRQVADPLGNLNIAEFYPHRAEGGPALARLTK